MRRLLSTARSNCCSSRTPRSWTSTSRTKPHAFPLIIARGTERVGLVAAGSTAFNEPCTPARQFKALDVISHGRAGWNAVTTPDPAAAANFARQLPAREERAAARIAAEVDDYVPGGDHTLLLAHVVTATAHANPRPHTPPALLRHPHPARSLTVPSRPRPEALALPLEHS
ncbi:LLM class flavin-dependent oxidoreductase [Streptomyces sp. NPDC047973]|uniref:LLM class flavin-dependent oxidoreductase n=1 Tax=Streptomyces sp. NPDC047973 TaxID=3155383 RepID=UPI00341DC028